eukprot:2273935-Rhodomonas_salina.5
MCYQAFNAQQGRDKTTSLQKGDKILAVDGRDVQEAELLDAFVGCDIPGRSAYACAIPCSVLTSGMCVLHCAALTQRMPVPGTIVRVTLEDGETAQRKEVELKRMATGA